MRKTELSATFKRAKGKRRCISNLFWGFLPFKFPPGRRLPLRARRRRLRQPKSETVQLTSTRQSVDNEGDRISKLRDDILIVILSFMTTKEATATCVLSKRWRYLCASLPRLDCSSDAYFRERFHNLYPQPPKQIGETLEKEKFMFINWVNSLVKMHQGQTLEEFRIDFPLDHNFSHVVDPWIEFALSKRLQRLVLDLSPTLGNGCLDWNYTFPNLLSPVTSSLSLVGLTSLTTLYLHRVSVKQEVVEHIISYCPVLEDLSLIYLVFMGYFKMAGPALKLKHLSLLYCCGLKCIDICDTNIVSFNYAGWKNSTKLHLKNVPHLVGLYVDMMDSPLSHAFDPISGLFSHLESLTLVSFGLYDEGGGPLIWDEDYFDIVAYPELSKLRHLVVSTDMGGDSGLLKLVPLINACPYLQRFVLQLQWPDHVRMTKEVVETIDCPHQHLKVVEFAGYYGRVSDVELAMYFIQNAVALERMIIIPKSSSVTLPAIDTMTVEMEEIKREEKARRLAKEQLQGNVRPQLI